MRRTGIDEAFHRALEGRRLLDHPYYGRWQAGDLTTSDLREYASQYRHVESSLPGVLSAAVETMPAGAPRDLVVANLADEVGRPRPHLDLFEDFAVAVGASEQTAPSPATRALTALYERAGVEGAAAVLSVVGAYEVQAAEIAATKAAALRGHYGLDEDAVAFWDVHAALESDHAAWTVSALGALDVPVERVERIATDSANAWWEFLSERDAAGRN